MVSLRLDSIDLKILDAVQRDGRITKLALAKKVGLSPTPCWMQPRAGVIVGYHARLSLRAVVPMTTAMMEVTLRNHSQSDFDRFERAIREIPQIVACWSAGGGLDYLLKIVTRDVDAYQRLIDGLLSHEICIDRYFTYVVTKTVREETMLPVETLADREPET